MFSLYSYLSRDFCKFFMFGCCHLKLYTLYFKENFSLKEPNQFFDQLQFLVHHLRAKGFIIDKGKRSSFLLEKFKEKPTFSALENMVELCTTILPFSDFINMLDIMKFNKPDARMWIKKFFEYLPIKKFENKLYQTLQKKL